MAAVVRAARFVYLAGGSPLHLKSVLKGSATFEALREAWSGGAVVAGSAAGAMVLTDPMVDPRGGALTVGLGLVDQLAVVPQFGDGQDDAHGQKLERTVALAPNGLPVVGLPERTALLRDGDGTGATKVRRRRWCSSTASGPRGSTPCTAEPRSSPRRRPPRGSVALGDGDRLDHDRPRRLARTGAQGVDRRHDVATAHHGPEERVLRRQAHAVGPLMMKNWLPLVLGPALAMASEPTW